MEAISGTPTGGDPSVTGAESGAPPSGISETWNESAEAPHGLPETGNETSTPVEAPQPVEMSSLEPAASEVHGEDGTMVTVVQQADGGVEIVASETDPDGHVTIVEVDIDADGHAHGEVVELDADHHIVHAETVDVQPDGEVTVVEVDVEHDGGESVHHDEVALDDPSAHPEIPPSDTGEHAADGETEWVFDTDDYVPSTTPGDDWSPDE